MELWQALTPETRGASAAQTEPEGDWRTWLFLGGRGAGKTWAGAVWTLGQVAPARRIALVGPTLHDVREVMAGGPSGLIALSAAGDAPRWEQSRRRLVWADGSEAWGFSAEDPDSLRGHQFDGAWADEFCAWRRPAEALAMLRLGLRQGPDPRLVVTTTPRPTAALRDLRKEEGLVETHAATGANAANLSPGFVADLERLYGGTRLAAQELDGVVVDGGGALWRLEDLAAARGERPERLETVVVAVDPPASAAGDACGIVVAGRGTDGRAYVLADRTAGGMSPLQWAERACNAALAFTADLIVVEANQGGDMARDVLARAGPRCPVRAVYASRGKRARAEPVAALYEQGRVTHVLSTNGGTFTALEEELMALGGEDEGAARGRLSPDRADALVWALTELMLKRRGGPRVAVL